MNQNWRRDQLPALIAQLANRPGHEQVRVALTRLIVAGWLRRTRPKELRL